MTIRIRLVFLAKKHPNSEPPVAFDWLGLLSFACYGKSSAYADLYSFLDEGQKQWHWIKTEGQNDRILLD